MCFRALLSVAVLICTFPFHFSTANETIKNPSNQLIQIKDIVCLLLLSGVPKEDFGAEIMQKLRKYNVDLSKMDKVDAMALCNDTIESMHGYAKNLTSEPIHNITSDLASEQVLDSEKTMITLPDIINIEKKRTKSELQTNIEHFRTLDKKISTATSSNNESLTDYKINNSEYKLTERIQQILDKLTYLNETSASTANGHQSVQNTNSKPQTINVFIIHEAHNTKELLTTSTPIFPYVSKVLDTTTNIDKSTQEEKLPREIAFKPDNGMIYNKTYNERNGYDTNFGEIYVSHSPNTQHFAETILSPMQQHFNTKTQNIRVSKVENKVLTGKVMTNFSENRVPQSVTHHSTNGNYNSFQNEHFRRKEESFIPDIPQLFKRTMNPYIDRHSVPFLSGQSGIIENVNYEIAHNKKVDENLAYHNPEPNQMAQNIFEYNVPPVRTQRAMTKNRLGKVEKNPLLNTVPSKFYNGIVNENQYTYMQKATNTLQNSATAKPLLPKRQYRNHKVEMGQNRGESPGVEYTSGNHMSYAPKYDNGGPNLYEKRDFYVNPSYQVNSGNQAIIRNLEPSPNEPDEQDTYPIHAPKTQTYKSFNQQPLVLNNGNRHVTNSFENVHVNQDAGRNTVYNNRQPGSSELMMDNTENNEQIPRHYPDNHKFMPQSLPMPESQNIPYQINSHVPIPKYQKETIFTDNNYQKVLPLQNDATYDRQTISMPDNSNKNTINLNQHNKFQYNSDDINIPNIEPSHYNLRRSSNENFNGDLTQNEFLRMSRKRKDGRREGDHVQQNKPVVETANVTYMVQQIKELVIKELEELKKQNTSKGQSSKPDTRTLTSNEDSQIVIPSTEPPTVNNISSLKKNIVGIVRSLLKENASTQHARIKPPTPMFAQPPPMMMPPMDVPVIRVINMDLQNRNIKQNARNMHTHDARSTAHEKNLLVNSVKTQSETQANVNVASRKRLTQVQRFKNRKPISKEDHVGGQDYQKTEARESSKIKNKLLPQLRMPNDENGDYEIRLVKKKQKKPANDMDVDVQTRLQIPLSRMNKNIHQRVNDFVEKQENINTMLEKILKSRRKEPSRILRSTEESVEVL